MTEFLHEKVPAEGSCVVCDSSECPAAGDNQAILCQNRIPMLLEHGIRWMVVERAKMFNAFIPSIGGTIQLNSGDLGEGIAAIFSGDPGGGIGGHGPGLDLESGEVKTVSEIGGDTGQKRRFNHDFGAEPEFAIAQKCANNQYFYYLQLYGICRVHDERACAACPRSFESLRRILVICHRVSTGDTAWQELLNRWLAFVAVEERENNNFQLNAEQDPARDIVTNTLGDLQLPLYIEASFDIDDDVLVVRESNPEAGKTDEEAVLIEKVLFRVGELRKLCVHHELNENPQELNEEELVELLTGKVDIRGISQLRHHIREQGWADWEKRFGGAAKINNVEHLDNYLDG